MKRFVFDFSLDIWMQDVIIEAESYEEAKEKLLNVTPLEIVACGYCKDFNIKDLDCEEYEDLLSEED